MSTAHVEAQMPKLGPVEKISLLRGVKRPEYFKSSVRRMLYSKCGDDPERVQELMLDTMHREGKNATMFLPKPLRPPMLNIRIYGQDVTPFGTAAGMDKNGEALEVFGQIFGFQEPGTVILNPRVGNPRIRVATAETDLDMYNAQGFPSKGLDYFFENLSTYRRLGGEATIYVSICGLPVSEENPIRTSMDELQAIVQRIGSHADGFVWNPFSPNTAALKQLRTPEIFHQTAQLLSESAHHMLKLVKIGPYEPEEKEATLQLIRKFLDGGGNGVVTTNTKMTPKEQLPVGVATTWGYPSAGRGGAFLRSYRLRSVHDLRSAFPEIAIFATGGIYQSQDAFETFQAGATCIEGFTPYLYYGPGLVRSLIGGVEHRLKKSGFDNLEALQRDVRGKAETGKPFGPS